MATAAHRTRRGRFGLLFGTLFAAAVFAAVAYADIVQNNVVTTGTAQNDTITAGGSTTISYRIQVEGAGVDGLGGCNASDGSPVTIALSMPDAVTATSTAVGWNPVAKTLTYSTCNVFRAVTFSSAAPGDYPITVSSITDAGVGTYTNSANWTLHVNAPPNTAPVLTVPASFSVEGNTLGGAFVTFTVSMTDAEDDPDPAPTCSKNSGEFFPLGETTVSCSVVDSGGMVDSESFKVTVVDTTAPNVLVPADITAEATSPAGAAVSYTASADDHVDGALSPTCSPASGSTFALGTTEVTCSATDAAGNTASASFDVTVQDTTPPSVDVPDDIVAEATGPGGAAVTFTASAEDAVDGAIAPVCSPASGSTFPLGTTPVSCSATDNAGNSTTAGFSVTVRDTTPPSVEVPDDIVAEATGPGGAAVGFTASAHDLVDGAMTPTCSPAAGSTFVLGTTEVTCSAADAAGNTGSASFDVKVQDTTAPSVTVPADMTAEATGPSGAAVTYSTSAGDLVDGPITPTCSPVSGSTFALGTTTVHCSATDAAGNTGNADFAVSVEDTTAPSLALPADMTVPAADPSGAIVTYSASASDLVDGPVAVDCAPPSGSTFAPGTTTVRCSATDAAGNTATGSFKVQVTYQLRGFYQPVDMSGSSHVWNTVKGGSTVPLKFEVFAGATELTSTSVVNQPLKATQVPCSGGSEDTIELAATGGTSLRYDEAGGQFTYNWQTPKKPGYCYTVTVSTIEGSALVAYFKLK